MSEAFSRVTMSVRGLPTLSAAAKIIGVTPGTLSRRNLPFEAAGPKEHRLRPRTVLEEAGLYGRRPLRDVAEDLVTYCQDHAPESVSAVEAEVREVMERYEHPELLGHEKLLATAQQHLSPDQFLQLMALVREADKLPAIADMHASPEYLAELNARDDGVMVTTPRNRPIRARRTAPRASESKS